MKIFGLVKCYSKMMKFTSKMSKCSKITITVPKGLFLPWHSESAKRLDVLTWLSKLGRTQTQDPPIFTIFQGFQRVLQISIGLYKNKNFCSFFFRKKCIASFQFSVENYYSSNIVDEYKFSELLLKHSLRNGVSQDFSRKKSKAGNNAS
jgi:hypothetical protein